jgi:hypothetical protein
VASQGPETPVAPGAEAAALGARGGAAGGFDGEGSWTVGALSAEQAERFAARLRPMWEVDDDVAGPAEPASDAPRGVATALAGEGAARAQPSACTAVPAADSAASAAAMALAATPARFDAEPQAAASGASVAADGAAPSSVAPSAGRSPPRAASTVALPLRGARDPDATDVVVALPVTRPSRNPLLLAGGAAFLLISIGIGVFAFSGNDTPSTEGLDRVSPETQAAPPTSTGQPELVARPPAVDARDAPAGAEGSAVPVVAETRATGREAAATMETAAAGATTRSGAEPAVAERAVAERTARERSAIELANQGRAAREARRTGGGARPGAPTGPANGSAVSTGSGALAAAPPAPPGTVRLQLRSEPPGATLVFDGVRVRNPYDVRLAQGAGMHRVEATLAGYDPAIQTFDLTRDREVVVRLRPSGAAAPPTGVRTPAPPSPGGSRPRRGAGFVTQNPFD